MDDLIFYKEVPLANIHVGDTVVYKKPNIEGKDILVVHEVIQIGDGYATTKGINNAIADEPILVTAIVGKYIAKVPQAGIVLDVLSTSYAPLIILGLLVLLFMLRILVYCINKKTAIKKISKDKKNREAVNHFFDI